MDWILLLSGGGLTSVSYLAGWIVGRNSRRVSAPPKNKCDCGHIYSAHDKEKGCQVVVKTGWEGDHYKTRICACTRYVGPIPLDVLALGDGS